MTTEALITKHGLYNEAEAEYVQARINEGVTEEDAVARLKAARVGPAAESTVERHVPGGEGPSEPTGGLTEPEPVRTEPLTVEEAQAEFDAAKEALDEAKEREKEAAANAKANAKAEAKTPSAAGVPAEESNKEESNG